MKGTNMTRANNAAHGEAGFTLVEALIAMVILAIGLVAITNLFVVAAGSNTTASKSTGAAAHATEVMERLKATPVTGAGAVLVLGGDLNADVGLAAPCTDGTTLADCVAPGNFNAYQEIPGVGIAHARWTIVRAAQTFGTVLEPSQTVYAITVQSEILGPFGGRMSLAQFTTLRQF